MAFDFNRFKEEALNISKSVGDRANELSSAARSRIEIESKKAYLAKQYEALGRAYYAAHKGEDVAEADFFESISKAEAELEDLNNDVLDKTGAVSCPVCGLKQKKGNAFCSGCGAALQ